MGFFIVTGLFGLLFFIASLVFGDHDIGGHGHDVSGDHDHSTGPSVFSVFNIAWFLIGFGGTGSLMTANGASMPLSVSFGVLTGVLCGGIAFFSMRLLAKQQGDSTVTSARIINSVGTVVMSISETGVGKVQCSVAGSSQEFLARSAKAIKLNVGSRVKIVADDGGVYLVEAL